MNSKISEIDVLTKDVAQYSERIVLVENVKNISEESMKEFHKVTSTSEMGLQDVKQLEELVKRINEMSDELTQTIHA